MDLPPSGRSRARSDSPSLAADLISMLDIDDDEDGDTLSSFTLIPAASTVSSLGPSVQTRRAAVAAAAAASSGASGLPLSATPVRTGGGGIFVLAGEGLQGGLACGSVPCRQERLLLERLLLPARSARQVLYFQPRKQGTRSSASSLTPTVSALCALAEWGLQIAFASRQRTSLTRTVGYLLTGRARTEARNSPPRRELITRREVSPVAARPPR